MSKIVDLKKLEKRLSNSMMEIDIDQESMDIDSNISVERMDVALNNSIVEESMEVDEFIFMPEINKKIF